ncbi:hypothetical protein BsWGS_11401 [Bradybaena similaris]
MLAIYIHIGFIIRKQSVAIHKSRPAANNNSDGAINRRITWNMVRMPVTIFGTLYLFTTPTLIVNMYLFVTDGHIEAYISNIAYDVLLILALLHIWTNFFGYVLQDREFRSVLKSYYEIIRNRFMRIRIHPINCLT